MADGYLKDEAFDDPTTKFKASLFYGLGLAVCCFVEIGTLVPFFTDKDQLDVIRDTLNVIDSPLKDDLNLPYFLIVTACGKLFAGLIAIVSYYKQSKTWLTVSILIAVLASAGTVFINITVTTVIDNLVETLEGNPVTDEGFGTRENDVLDVTSAIYNTCCSPFYQTTDYRFGLDENDPPFPLTDNIPAEDPSKTVDTTQSDVRVCAETFEETCPDGMFPEATATVLENVEGGNQLLCHCIVDRDKFDAIVQFFQEDDTCNRYRDVRIQDLDNVEIPVIEETFSRLLSTGLPILGFQEMVDEFPIGEVAVVGKPLPAVSLYGEPAEEVGFSCGIGYAKSIAFMLYLVITRSVDVAVLGSYVAAGLALFFTGITLLAILCVATEEKDVVDEYEQQEKKNDTEGNTNSKKKSKNDEYDEY